jgi:hypothetical protein
MFCRKCGKQVPDNAVFCAACGTRIDTPPVAPVAAPEAPVTGAASVAPASAPIGALAGAQSPTWLPKALKAGLVGAVIAIAVALLLSFATRSLIVWTSDRVIETSIAEVGAGVPVSEISEQELGDLLTGLVDDLTPGILSQWATSHGGRSSGTLEIDAQGESGRIEYTADAPFTIQVLVPFLALLVGIGVAHLMQGHAGLGALVVRGAVVVLVYSFVLFGVTSVLGSTEMDVLEVITDSIDRSVGPDEAEEFIEGVGLADAEMQSTSTIDAAGAAVGALLIGLLSFAVVTPLRFLGRSEDDEWRRRPLVRTGRIVKHSVWAVVLCAFLAVALAFGTAVLQINHEGDDFADVWEAMWEPFDEIPQAYREALYVGAAYAAPTALGYADAVSLGGTLRVYVEANTSDDVDDSVSIFDAWEDIEEPFDLTAFLILLAPLMSGAILGVVVGARGRFRSTGELTRWLVGAGATFLLLQLALMNAIGLAGTFESSGAFGRDTAEYVFGIDLAASLLPAAVLTALGVALGGFVCVRVARRRGGFAASSAARVAAAAVTPPGAPAGAEDVTAGAPAAVPEGDEGHAG